MKRSTRIVVLIAILVLSTLLLSGCVEETLHLDEKTEAATYFLYETNDSNKYLKFLENFDDNTYELIDISVAHGNWFYVTYRIKKAE